tara:strand:- start:1226 stop:1471 length:246 start_codon:yes stop_codon:yes gene_type:complete
MKNHPTEQILTRVKYLNSLCSEFITYGFTPDREDCFGVSIVITMNAGNRFGLPEYTQLIDKTYTIKTGKCVNSEIIEEYYK